VTREEDDLVHPGEGSMQHAAKQVALARTLEQLDKFTKILPYPALKLAFGEFAQHVVDSARVIPENLAKAGFTFRHPELGEALRDTLK
jgi:NAD dependent epimerase/dehydratase family enzyme